MGVTMHANWFSANNHNGVTFVSLKRKLASSEKGSDGKTPVLN